MMADPESDRQEAGEQMEDLWSVVVAGFPLISEAILVGGFLAYAWVCMPVIGWEGRLEDLDPFRLSFAWLWVVPVVLSAPLVRMSKRRAWGLAFYALAASAIMTGCYGPFAEVRPIDMVLGVPLIWGPILLPATALIEAAARGLLRCLRLSPGEGMASAQRALKRYMIAVALLTIAFPFVFRAADLAYEQARGRRMAERDWRTGEACLFLHTDELSGAMVGLYDEVTGLLMEDLYGGVARRTWMEAYGESIDAKLAEFGPAPMAAYLLSAEEVESLIAEGRLGSAAKSLWEADRLGVTRDSPYEFSQRDEAARLAGETIVAETGGVRVVLKEGMIETWHPDDWVMQRYYVWVGEGARDAAGDSPSRRFAEKMCRLVHQRDSAAATSERAPDGMTADPSDRSDPSDPVRGWPRGIR
jgi:hypothetical protein